MYYPIIIQLVDKPITNQVRRIQTVNKKQDILKGISVLTILSTLLLIVGTTFAVATVPENEGGIEDLNVQSDALSNTESVTINQNENEVRRSTASSTITIKSIANGRVNIYNNSVAIGYVTGGASAQTFTFSNGGNYKIEAVPNSGYIFDKFCNAANQCVTTNPITGYIAPTGNYLTYNGYFKLSSGGGGVSPTIRLMTIGDPHLSSSTSSASYKNLTKAVNYINTRSDVDLTVVLGDISSLSTAKTILGKLNKPYRVIAGNHDIASISQFSGYFGFPAAHKETFNGFQLIFVGIKGTTDYPAWSFDYSTVDKTKPTIIFNHGPVQPKPGGTCSSWGSYYGYACGMKTETDKFTNLFGYYSGHVHTGTNKKIGNTLYVTEDNLGGAGDDSLYIGYTVIKDGVTTYSRVKY